MTEYDYSPDAVERYMENQNRVAGWVTGQAYEAPRYKDPLIPTPSIAHTQLPPERPKHTRSRSHSSSHQQPSSRSRTSSHSHSSSNATWFVPHNPPPMPGPVPLARQPTRSYTTPVQASPMPVYPSPQRSHTYDVRPHTAQGFHHHSHSVGIQPNTVYFPGAPYPAQASSPHIAYQRNEPVVIPANSYIVIPNARQPIMYGRGSPTSPTKKKDIPLLKRVLGTITWSSNKSSERSESRSRSKSRSRRHSIGH